jgi:hypothetical protein
LYLPPVNRVQLFHHLIRMKTDRLVALTARDFQPSAVWSASDRTRREQVDRDNVMARFSHRALSSLTSSRSGTGSRRPFRDRTNLPPRSTSENRDDHGPPRQLRRLDGGGSSSRSSDNQQASRSGRGSNGFPPRGGGRGRRGGRDGGTPRPSFRPYSLDGGGTT